MSAIINYILDQQDVRKAKVRFRLNGEMEYRNETIDVPFDIRKDEDSIADYCNDRIEEKYGEVKWLRAEIVID